jgi:hypothetical protein
MFCLKGAAKTYKSQLANDAHAEGTGVHEPDVCLKGAAKTSTYRTPITASLSNEFLDLASAPKRPA